MLSIVNRSRRGETNKSLLIVLGVVVVIAGGYWAFRLMTSESAPKPAPVSAAEPVSFYCYSCNKTFEVPAGEVAAMKPDPTSGRYECRLCKKVSAAQGYGPSARVPRQP